jgi:glutaredoxin-related protein
LQGLFRIIFKFHRCVLLKIHIHTVLLILHGASQAPACGSHKIE